MNSIQPTAGPVEPGAVSLPDFLQGAFGDDAPRAWLACVPDGNDRAGFFGARAAHCDLDGPGWATANNYYSVAVLGPRATSRDDAHWERTHVIVIDDVGEKCSADAVRGALDEPSAIVQTSPGSQQWIYMLASPLTDAAMQAQIMRAITIAFFGGKDPGHGDLARYVRLPCGVNNKPARVAANGGVAPGVVLRTWHPERRFDPVLDFAMVLDARPGLQGKTAWQEAAGASVHRGRGAPVANLSGYIEHDEVLQACARLGWLGRPQQNNYVGVKCPLGHAHQKDDDSTGWNPVARANGQDAFKCHHSSHAGAGYVTTDMFVDHVRQALDARDGAGSFDKLAAECRCARAAAVFSTVSSADVDTGKGGTFARRSITVRKGELHVTTREALQRLTERGGVFQRAGAPVSIKRVSVKTPMGTHTAPRIVPVKKAEMLVELSAAARWGVEKIDKQGARKFEDCDPPENVAEAIIGKTLEAADCLDVLSGTINAPFLRRDGTVAQADGEPRYDAETGLWIDPGGVAFRPVLDAECTKADALAALETLRKPLRGYAFDGDPSQAVAVASLLLPFARPGIALAPGIAIDAPLKGSGKTKLASLPAILATGEPPALIAPSRNSAEELDKQFNAALIGGAPAVVLDNIVGEGWGTNTICAALTAERLKVRPLHSSDARDIANTAVVTVTGNNLTFPSDTSRRFLVCRINPGVERPETRTFSFDPVAEVKENRAALVHAVLTILRAYQLAGAPAQGGAALGSFEEFARRVRDALMWLGLPDIAKATATGTGAEGAEQSALADVLSAWANHPALSTGEHSAREIAAIAGCAADGGALRDALTAACGDRLDTVALGKWLAKHKDQPVAGVIIKGRLDRTRVMVWRIDGAAALAGKTPGAKAPASAPVPANAGGETKGEADSTDAERMRAARAAFAGATALPGDWLN